MPGHVSLHELHERLFATRKKLLTDQGMSPKQRALATIMVVSYIATTIASFAFGQDLRSIETLKERALTEEMAFSMIFGPAASLGLIAGLGILYAQADAILSIHLSTLGIALRAFIAALIAAMYVTSWRVTFQRLRRDRMKMLLEFGLERLLPDTVVTPGVTR